MKPLDFIALVPHFFCLEQRLVKTLYLLRLSRLIAQAEGDSSDRSALYP